MKLSKVGYSQNFRANEVNSPQEGGASSSLMTVASNAAVGVAVGGITGAVRCALPVSKNDVAQKLTEALAVYKKTELPLASEVSSLSNQFHVATNNSQWFKFIKNVEDMGDDVFVKEASKLANSVGIKTGSGLFKKKAVEEVVTKSQIIDAAKTKLIGEAPTLMEDGQIVNLGNKLTQKTSELFEYAKKMISDNPKDELVQLAKKVARKARNSKALSSSIRFGVMAAMVFCLMSAIKSGKQSDKQ